MRRAVAVIGAGFGDEGKGLITDYLARQVKDPLVCRFNGGSQAGHTVVDGNRRHIFGHVGAGTFAGGSTYLAKNFIVNPLVAERELRELQAKGKSVSYVLAHPEAQVTTIYDMAINTLVELSRGSRRHGSCGMGINETVTRGEKFARLTVGALENASRGSLAASLRNIAEHWVPRRLEELRLAPADIWAAQRTARHIEVLVDDNYAHHAEALRQTATAALSACVPLTEETSVILEGAQGLRLDEFLGEFPHVTRSVTGLPYAWEAAAELDVTELQPIYVTRCYTTRHGAGPLPHEGEFITDRELSDTTNVVNPWQGHLRYAPLDIDALKSFIDKDIYRSRPTRPPLLAVTCLDQLGNGFNVIVNGRPRTLQLERDLVPLLEREVGLKVALTSYGPSASDVRARQVFYDVISWYNVPEKAG